MNSLATTAPRSSPAQKSSKGWAVISLETVFNEDSMLHKLGETRPGVWAIKHIVAPLDRWLYQYSGGKVVLTGRSTGPILLFSTVGKKPGKTRMNSVFFLRDHEKIILCNVNPGFEHTNPWVLNFRAHPIARVQIASEIWECRAREANQTEVEHYWLQLTHIWPAYTTHFKRSGKRAIFILEKVIPPMD